MNRTALLPTVEPFSLKGSNEMLFQEALARMRMHEAEQSARAYRQARRLTAGRGWRRLAEWAQRRAERALIEP